MDEDIRGALLDTFREEAKELLADLETVLMELEVRPDDEGLVARAFRALHTIKGNGAMFGFSAVESFAHELEQAFDLLRTHKAKVSKGLIDLTLSAKDEIASMLEREGDEDVVTETRKQLLEAIQNVVNPRREETEVEEEDRRDEPSPEAATGVDAQTVYRVRFRPPAEIFGTGPEPAGLMAALKRLGPCRVMALTDRLPPLEGLDPTTCYLGWDAILSTDRGIQAIREIFLPLGDGTELQVDVIEGGGLIEGEGGERMLGEILVERGDLREEDVEQVLREQKRFGEVLVERRLAAPEKVESALLEQQAVRELRTKRVDEDQKATIRVHSHKLDGLVNLVGELVTVQARLSRLETEIKNSELTSIAEEVESLTWSLRDNAFSVRMVPFGTTFSKFRRLVRDLSGEMGREVDLVTEGAETELDKTVIEKLNDPLVHLIRNSMDHGIETPEARARAGKARRGKVRLAARQSGADILIEISDDGAGLDGEAILKKAVEKGLVERGAHLSREEIFALIFQPGFSTARKVTSVSGRGVGMDVVKTSIDTLRGTVAVRSEMGKGTTVIIRLPLTLAIIEGLEVVVGHEIFVIPLSFVEECVELRRRQEAVREGRHLTNVRGDLVPYVPLRDWFHVQGEPPTIEQAVITRTDGGRVGLVVDHVVGEHQTVVKTLGKVYQGLKGFSGATILGDGTVALILDVPHLVSGAEQSEKSHFAGAGPRTKEMSGEGVPRGELLGRSGEER